jgi:hypothetical protein
MSGAEAAEVQRRACMQSRKSALTIDTRRIFLDNLQIVSCDRWHARTRVTALPRGALRHRVARDLAISWRQN